VLFAINTMNFFDRQVIASVSKPIIDEWGISDTKMGLMGTAFTLIYAVVGVPLGRWADQGARTKILSIGVTLWSLFTAASGLAWNYWSLFMARMGVGIGEASCSPASNSLIGDLYPPSKRARAISVFMLGLPIGIFFSNLLSGIIAKNYGWRMTFFVAGIPGLFLAVLALRIREPKRGAAETVQLATSAVQAGSPYKRVLSIPTMWWIILSGALHNFNAYAVNSFMPLYLGRYHGLDVQQANFIAAIVLGAVGVIGLLGGGYLADLVRKRPNGRMLLSALSLLISTPCVFLALGQPKGSLVTYMLLMGFGWMLIYVYYVTVYPVVQDVVEPGLRGTAMALYFCAMYLLGGAFGTYILGFLSDHFGKQAMLAAGQSIEGIKVVPMPYSATGLHDAFYVVPIVSLALAAVLFAGSLTVAKDMAKLQEWMQRAASK
jgi:MFS family permease